MGDSGHGNVYGKGYERMTDMNCTQSSEFYWEKTLCRPDGHTWIYAGADTNDEPDPMM